MPRVLHALVLLLVGLPLAVGETAPRGLAALLQAREELGEAEWSAVVSLSTAEAATIPEGALIFEFAQALWFYRPTDGTQSLSRHWNNVAADRRNLLPLLQAIDPAYTGFRELDPAEWTGTTPAGGALPNGCFVQSVGMARRLEQSGEPVNGCLISYYADTRNGQQGHTVLCYADAKGSHVFDPADGRTTKAPRRLSWSESALNLAKHITPAYLARRLTKAAKIALWGGDPDSVANTGHGRSTRAGAPSLR